MYTKNNKEEWKKVFMKIRGKKTVEKEKKCERNQIKN